jgi:hypothetical protein
VQTCQLPGDPDTPWPAGPKFADVFIALLRDSEQSPLRGPVQPSLAGLIKCPVSLIRRRLSLEARAGC